MPVAAFEGEVIVVDREEQVHEAVAYLRTQPVIGVDTEARPSFTRGVHYPTALVQIASHERCYLFRLTHVGMPQELADLFADETPDTDMDYLTNELNQAQTQTLVDDLYQAVLTICGMPNRNGKTSTSDNKGAVVLRDGWSAAAIAVKETKQYFEASERRMLAMALKAFNIYRDAVVPKRKPLSLEDVDIHFDEGEYENTLEKAQVLQMLLNNDWVHPRNAYEFSNITSDPEAAYLAGKEYHEAVQAQELDMLENGNTEQTYVTGHWRANHG